MRSLAAAISPGYLGFTDWAFAAEATSEIAVQVPIATRKNNALIIISSHIRPSGQGVHGLSDISLACRGSIGNTFSVFVSCLLRILLTVC